MDGTIDWTRIPAAIWRPHRGALHPVADPDPVALDDLVGIERQKAALVRNTERFVAGQPANNALLWGARGTGKSSLIKAVFNRFRADGLRLIQVDRDSLVRLPEIVDDIRHQPQRFVIYCDDLGFEPGEAGYRALKTVLEGSIERPADNVRVYATSNRRHLVPEYMADNLAARREEGELHPSDAVEETISLSDRFGLWLSFHPLSQDEYLAIVDHLFAGRGAGREAVHAEALRYALARGVRSGRTARQFFNQFFEPPAAGAEN